MSLPCDGGYVSLQHKNTYDLLLALVTIRLWRAESCLHLIPSCATCVHNLLLCWRAECMIDEMSITDDPAT